MQVSFIKNSKKWQRGKDFWKFNIELLKDKDYVDKINLELSDFEDLEQTFDNKSLLWDFIRCKLRGITISFAAFRAKRNRQQEAKLQEKLHQIEGILDTTPSSKTVKNIWKELENIYMEKVHAAAILSRAEFVENNECNSKFFLGLEKENYNLRCIKCLNTADGQITNEKDILKEELKYYKDLYSESHIPNPSLSVENEFLTLTN